MKIACFNCGKKVPKSSIKCYMDMSAVCIRDRIKPACQKCHRKLTKKSYLSDEEGQQLYELRKDLEDAREIHYTRDAKGQEIVEKLYSSRALELSKMSRLDIERQIENTQKAINKGSKPFARIFVLVGSAGKFVDWTEIQNRGTENAYKKAKKKKKKKKQPHEIEQEKKRLAMEKHRDKLRTLKDRKRRNSWPKLGVISKSIYLS